MRGIAMALMAYFEMIINAQNRAKKRPADMMAA